MTIDRLVQSLETHFQTDGPDLQRALTYLSFFGYFNPARYANANTFSMAAAMEDSLAAFQRSAGLMPTGEIDDQTLTAMSRPRCGCPDVQSLGGGSGKWSKRELTWKVQSYVPAVPSDLQDAVFESAYKSWANVCGMTFRRVSGNSNSDLTIFASPIDGPGNVLAQAQLPPGNDKPLWLQLDSSESKWAMSVREQGIKLLNTFAHESGHNLGLDHSSLQTALMFWQYSDVIATPQQQDDIPRVQSLYGPSKVMPTPAPSPMPAPAAGKNWIRIEFDGAMPSFKVYKG